MADLFTALVEKYADTVTRLCFVNLENKSDAEDIWQNVFFKLWRSPKMWSKPDEELRKWLVTVTLNECRDAKRRLFHRNHADIDELQVAYEQEQDLALIHEVRALPAKYAQPIILFYFEGYSVREIAVILSEKENTVKSRLQRGRELLKGALTDE